MKAVFERIYEATGSKTQVDLAERLDIRQSSISDAKRRNSVPDAWLITILKMFSVNPNWILTGKGAKFLQPSGIAHSPEMSVTELERQMTLQFAVDRFGIDLQLAKAAEELLEAAAAVLRVLQSRSTGHNQRLLKACLASEMADVKIMFDQLCIMFPELKDLADEAEQAKLLRLAGILEERSKKQRGV